MSAPEATEADPLLRRQRSAIEAAEAAQAKIAETQAAMDKRVDNIVNALGAEKYLNQLLNRKQAESLYPTTLFVARLCKGCLIFFVVVCTMGLLTGFLFQGSLELLEEINQVDAFEAPKLMLCPQPWGHKFAVRPHVSKAAIVAIPGGEQSPLAEETKHQPGNFTHIPCAPEASQCHCLDFTSVTLRPKEGARAGEYDYWPYLRVEFQAANAGEAPGEQYAFGFYALDHLMPQTWSYSRLGYVTQGDVSAEEVAAGKTEFTDGEPCPRYGFRRTGEQINKHADGRTVLIFGYDVFMLYVIATVGSKWSVFSLVTLCLLFCAAINNFGLFDILFPEQLDEDDPAQLMPNPILTTLCGRCCMCLKPKEEPAAEETGGV